jgi:serine/threonine protein kinase
MPARPRHVATAQPKQKPQQRPAPKRWNGAVLGLKGIGRGISGMVFVLDDKTVVKVGFGSDESTRDIETERRAYGILQAAKNRSPHILRCVELDNPRGLVLELCHETVRQRLRSIPKDVFPSDMDARKWAKQAAEGLAFIHEQDIIHADVGCHNMLLDSDNTLKLCDFGGSSVRGSLASTKYEVWSRLPSKGESKPTKTSDLFALGSAIYEISTKEEPYRGKTLAEVSQLYQQGQFPPVIKIASLGDVIMHCWLQKYTSASDIAREIDPQQLLCCRTQESPANGILPSPEEALILSPTMDTSITSSSSASAASQSITKKSSSSSSSSSSWTKESNTPRQGSLKKSPIKGTTRHIHEYKQSVDCETRPQPFFERASSKENKKPTRRKTNNRSLISQWINKSL